MGNSNDSKPFLQDSIARLRTVRGIEEDEFWSAFWGSIGSADDLWGM